MSSLRLMCSHSTEPRRLPTGGLERLLPNRDNSRAFSDVYKRRKARQTRSHKGFATRRAQVRSPSSRVATGRGGGAGQHGATGRRSVVIALAHSAQYRPPGGRPLHRTEWFAQGRSLGPSSSTSKLLRFDRNPHVPGHTLDHESGGSERSPPPAVILSERSERRQSHPAIPWCHPERAQRAKDLPGAHGSGRLLRRGDPAAGLLRTKVVGETSRTTTEVVGGTF